MNSKTKLALAAAVLILSPFAALAMPAIGDIVGTNADDVRAAMDKAGCAVESFESEGGKVEAVCKDAATGAMMEVVIDPVSGAVTAITNKD